MSAETDIQEDDESVAAILEEKLLASLRESLPQAANTSIVFTVKDPSGEIIGGVTASTSYSWLLIKLLWVDNANRQHGLGRALMEKAEQHGIDTGCHNAWLDTSSPDAMAFYTRLGYRVFGEIINSGGHTPPDHHRWFMKKSLQ